MQIVSYYWSKRSVLLTSGTKGGSSMPASKRRQFSCVEWKNGCAITSWEPMRPLRQPKRCFIDLAKSCWHIDLASSLNLLEYFSASSCRCK